MTTSEMIKKLCDIKNISLSELARRLGQSPQNFGKKLKRETVTLEELVKIAELTGTSFEQAFVIDNGERISTDNTASMNQKHNSKMTKSIENDLRKILLSISHSFRVPLNSIVGFSDMVVNSKDNYEHLLDYTEKIKVAADNITKYIDNLTEMASLSQNEDESSVELVNTKTAIERFSEYMADFIEKRGVKLNFEFKGVGDSKFYCNVTRVNRVMRTIIENAARFTPKGSNVDIVIEKFETRQNNKIGIRCIVMNRFDVIERSILKNIEKILNDESGYFSWTDFNAEQLELAIVRKNMDKLNSSINMTSDETNGTKVTMEFTFALAKQKEEPANDETTFEGKRILIVEDNALNSEILRELLSIVGIVTEVAEDGQVAVDRFEEVGRNYYDAVLMDIQMPKMDGYEASRRIREICGDKRIPIIAITANAFEEDRQKSLECGLDAHMSKPVDYNKLLILLKKFMFLRK